MKRFTRWLESDLTHFVSLIEEGSNVAGDPWQEGFSDHDVTIVVSNDQEMEMAAVFEWLQENPFDDSFLFGPRLAHEFVHGDSLNDISLKFRARTVCGKDLVKEKDLPNRQRALDLGLRGLHKLEMPCLRRSLNLAHWTLEHAQQKNYEIFKSVFVHAAAKIYGESGVYPTTRADVAAVLSANHAMHALLAVTNNIATSTKEQQKAAFGEALILIRKM